MREENKRKTEMTSLMGNVSITRGVKKGKEETKKEKRGRLLTLNNFRKEEQKDGGRGRESLMMC